MNPLNHNSTFSEQAQHYLQDAKILFEIKNNGVQLIVEGLNSHIDYYPSTGKWVARSTSDIKQEKGFGLKSLIRYCQQIPKFELDTPDLIINHQREFDPTQPNPASYTPSNKLIGTK